MSAVGLVDPVGPVEYIDHAGSDELDFWICRFERGEAVSWGIHRHEQHQLVWTAEGSATVAAPGRAWIVTPAHAVWIPSECPHDVHVAAGAVLVCVYVWPRRCPLVVDGPTEMAIGPIARELLLHLDHAPADGRGDLADAYLAVLFDQLMEQPAVDRPTLPMPADPRAADVAIGLLADPACRYTVEQWADVVAASPSTIRRAFLAGTSLTFSEWRARARVEAALPLLADGISIAEVAERVGYGSRSGFVAAYRRHFGYTPTL